MATIRFSKRDNAVLVNRPDGSEIARAPVEDFWMWIASSALAESLRAFEVAYGVPKVDADEGGYRTAPQCSIHSVQAAIAARRGSRPVWMVVKRRTCSA